GESFALHGLGIAQLRRGKHDEAATLLERSLTAADTSRNRLAEAHALAGLGELSIARGQPGDAIGRLRRAVTLYRQMRVPLFEAHTLIMMSEVLRQLGDVDGSDAALGRVQELVELVDGPARRSLRDHLDGVAHRTIFTAHPTGGLGCSYEPRLLHGFMGITAARLYGHYRPEA